MRGCPCLTPGQGVTAEHSCAAENSTDDEEETHQGILPGNKFVFVLCGSCSFFFLFFQLIN